jgi:hypothetical protein
MIVPLCTHQPSGTGTHQAADLPMLTEFDILLSQLTRVSEPGWI